MTLISFKTLVLKSYSFIRDNFRSIIISLLPIEVAVLIIALIYDFIPETDSTPVIIFVILTGIVSFVVLAYKKVFAFGYPLVIKDIEDGKTATSQSMRQWYRQVLARIIPIIWIQGLVLLLNIVFVFVALIIVGLIFTIPTIIVALLVRVGLGEVAQFFYPVVVNNTTLLISGGILFLGFVVSVVLFFANSAFSVYSYLFEGRRGIHAITTSFLLVGQNRIKIVFRLIGIWIFSLIPFVVLVFPVYIKIISDVLRAVLLEVFVLGIEPALPPIALGVSVFRDVLTLFASLLSFPIFAVMSYFLWQDVKSIAPSFDEAQYTKTYYWIKKGVYFGFGILILIIVVSIIISALSI